MTDTLPPLAPAPTGASTETLAAADTLFARHGYTPEQRAQAGYRAAGSVAPGPAAPPAADAMKLPGNAGPSGQAEQTRPATAASNLPYEVKRDALIKLKGVVDDATILAAAKAEGVNPADLQITAPAAPEKITLNEANARLEAQGNPLLAAGNSPVDYSFEFDPNEIVDLNPDDLAGIARSYKDAFFQAQLPMASAQAIVRESMATINRLEGLSDAARELEMKNQGAILKRSGNINEIVRYAELALARLPEDFRNEMYSMHAFSSADAYNALASAGRLIEAREARHGRAKK